MAELTELKVSQMHPCFSRDAHNQFGRLHLPVSPACNIQCRFCERSINRTENRPGVAGGILASQDAVETVRKALQLCPEITVVGIAGPGDTLATDDALAALEAVHETFPNLIKCLSTNGLLLQEKAERLVLAGVQTVTVTVNAISPQIAEKVVSRIVYKGKAYTGRARGKILIKKQLDGIKKASGLGLAVKVNTVLIPGVNDHHIEEIAKKVQSVGAHIHNIIPLIPQHEFRDIPPPSCDKLHNAKRAAAKYLEVFHHCKHCRADACGIPGKSDLSDKLYGRKMETFSHG